MMKTFAACLAIALTGRRLAGPGAAGQAAPAAPKPRRRHRGPLHRLLLSQADLDRGLRIARCRPSPASSGPQRIQFVTVVSQGTIQSAYRVPYAVFAKGEKADRMIIVGLQQGELNTVYRMRALLANMTTMSRLSPFFQERTVAEDATFFDLLKLLGFPELTITDGEKVTHQVTIK